MRCAKFLYGYDYDLELRRLHSTIGPETAIQAWSAGASFPGHRMPIDPSTAFVSYSREDLEFVLRLTKDLKVKGAKVWMDKLDIRPGQRWEIEVETALNKCSRMMVILSPT